MNNQPQTQPQQFNVVQNQVNIPQNEELRLQDALRSHTIYCRCPHCSYDGLTSVDKSCSCANVCCSIWFTPLTWMLFQACRSKDINCYDVKHGCTKCGRPLGVYTAC